MKKNLLFIIAGALMLSVGVNSQKGKSIPSPHSDTTKPKIYIVKFQAMPASEWIGLNDTLGGVTNIIGKTLTVDQRDQYLEIFLRQWRKISSRASIDSTK